MAMKRFKLMMISRVKRMTMLKMVMKLTMTIDVGKGGGGGGVGGRRGVEFIHLLSVDCSSIPPFS